MCETLGGMDYLVAPFPRKGEALQGGISGAVFLRKLQYFCEPEPVPRLPGPAVGPKGPKSAQNQGPDLSFYPP